jgi:outer membrane protein OmpA-like peptidoglycan-associated protein
MGDVIDIPGIEYYLSGGCHVTRESRDSLDGILVFLKEWPELKVEIACHTDSRGNGKSNVDLSTRRAKSVAEYLIMKGVDANRVTYKGYGEEVPIVPNEQIDALETQAEKEELYAINRRTEMKIRE